MLNNLVDIDLEFIVNITYECVEKAEEIVEKLYEVKDETN